LDKKLENGKYLMPVNIDPQPIKINDDLTLELGSAEKLDDSFKFLKQAYNHFFYTRN
jgi:hypothetical protein